MPSHTFHLTLADLVSGAVYTKELATLARHAGFLLAAEEALQAASQPVDRRTARPAGSACAPATRHDGGVEA